MCIWVKNLKLFSWNQNTSTRMDTDWHLSSSASSDGPWYDGRQHNLRFNYGLKNVLHILRPKITQTQQTRRRPFNSWWHWMTFFLNFLFMCIAHILLKVLLRVGPSISTRNKLVVKAQHVTIGTICLMSCNVWCGHMWCVSNKSPSTKRIFLHCQNGINGLLVRFDCCSKQETLFIWTVGLVCHWCLS